MPTFRLDLDVDSNLIQFVVVYRSMHLVRMIDQWTIVVVDSIDYYCFVVGIAVDRWSYPYFVREMLVDRFVKHSVLDVANANY